MFAKEYGCVLERDPDVVNWDLVVVLDLPLFSLHYKVLLEIVLPPSDAPNSQLASSSSFSFSMVSTGETFSSVSFQNNARR